MGSVDLGTVLALVALLLLSAFFSSAEVAFVSQQRSRLRHLASQGSRVAAEIEGLVNRPARLLSTILLGNNVVNVAAASLGTSAAVALWGLERGVLIATVGITLLLLVFGEITPKVFAAAYANLLATLFAYPIRFIEILTKPAIVVLGWVAEGVSRLLGGGPSPGIVSEEDIRAMTALSRAEGVVEPEEAEMVERVFRFGDRLVREVMTPRPEIVWVAEGATFSEFLPIYLSGTHTRFPVYQGSMDNVVGVLVVKDVLKARAEGAVSDNSTITDLVRPPLFVPETKRTGVLFTEMRESGDQMALIVDEFGTIAGLITLTRLVQEIVGDLGDEFTEEEASRPVDADTFSVDGIMRVEDANQRLGLGLPVEEDYETVAGFLLTRLGHIPEEGEGAAYNDLFLTVERMRGAKIDRILVARRREPQP